MRELVVAAEGVVRERRPDDPRDTSLLIYDLEGELFFGAAPPLHTYLSRILEEARRAGGVRYVVLRLRRARHPDVVAIEQLEHFLRDAEQAGVTMLLAGLTPEFVKILDNVGLTRRLGAHRLFPEGDKDHSATLSAVRLAYELIQDTAPSDPDSEHPATPTYYLV
jgi:sulfate permease, SulP family